ncbi:MAG: large conductance mechanosensitive channel protein MscL [Deltaproteobacteria bacterium]
MGLLSDFKQFVLRGNITDLAIGFTVGAAFTTVVKSAVEDLVMPPVGLLVGEVDFTQQFWVLAPGKNGEAAFETMAQAKAAGAVTLNYGNFINNCIALLVVALVMFAVVKFIRRVEKQMEEEAGGEAQAPEEPANKKCPFCLETIAFKAVRCPECTSELDGFRARRDKPGVALNEMGAAADQSSP